MGKLAAGAGTVVGTVAAVIYVMCSWVWMGKMVLFLF